NNKQHGEKAPHFSKLLNCVLTSEQSVRFSIHFNGYTNGIFQFIAEKTGDKKSPRIVGNHVVNFPIQDSFNMSLIKINDSKMVAKQALIALLIYKGTLLSYIGPCRQILADLLMGPALIN